MGAELPISSCNMYIVLYLLKVLSVDNVASHQCLFIFHLSFHLKEVNFDCSCPDGWVFLSAVHFLLLGSIKLL